MLILWRKQDFIIEIVHVHTNILKQNNKIFDLFKKSLEFYFVYLNMEMCFFPRIKKKCNFRKLHFNNATHLLFIGYLSPIFLTTFWRV